MTIARVFPSRTSASPDDNLAFFAPPPKEAPAVDEVHISAVFTWDIPKGRKTRKTMGNSRRSGQSRRPGLRTARR